MQAVVKPEESAFCTNPGRDASCDISAFRFRLKDDWNVTQSQSLMLSNNVLPVKYNVNMFAFFLL